MKNLTQLIQEQKKYFCDTYNTGHYWLYRLDKSQDAYTSCGSAVLDWHTTAQQQLIDVIIESINTLRHELGQQCPEATDNLLESWKEGHTKALHEIITLLEEAKKNV